MPLLPKSKHSAIKTKKSEQLHTQNILFYMPLFVFHGKENTQIFQAYRFTQKKKAL